MLHAWREATCRLPECSPCHRAVQFGSCGRCCSGALRTMPFVPSGLRKGDRKSLKLAWTLGQNRTGHCRCSRPAATLAWSFEIGVSTELQFPAQAWGATCQHVAMLRRFKVYRCVVVIRPCHASATLFHSVSFEHGAPAGETVSRLQAWDIRGSLQTLCCRL